MRNKTGVLQQVFCVILLVIFEKYVQFEVFVFLRIFAHFYYALPGLKIR